jgi:hypothetical protein
MGSSHQVSTTAKKIVDRTMSRKEPLGLPRRLETSHLALSLASGLMRDLSPVIQASVLPVGDTGEHLAARSSVAAQLIGDEVTRHIVQSLWEEDRA